MQAHFLQPTNQFVGFFLHHFTIYANVSIAAVLNNSMVHEAHKNALSIKVQNHVYTPFAPLRIISTYLYQSDLSKKQTGHILQF